jgi:hypothetical protein
MICVNVHESKKCPGSKTTYLSTALREINGRNLRPY